MALAAAPIFFLDVEFYVTRVLTLVVLVCLLWALVDCLIRRTDAFTAIGTLPKWGWLAILAVAVVLVYFLSPISLFGMVGTFAAAYYLLDVRRGVREVTEGPW
jgi:uncharacterized protein involved in cysteine biosynthesis